MSNLSTIVRDWCDEFPSKLSLDQLETGAARELEKEHHVEYVVLHPPQVTVFPRVAKADSE